MSEQQNFQDCRFPAEKPLAMAYVPMQKWKIPYDEETALKRGTMFPELDLPFTAGFNGGVKYGKK